MKSHPSICPSVTVITVLGLLTSTYQLPNIINPSSSYFKFVTASKCSDQLAFCSCLKTKKWRKLEQHSIKTTVLHSIVKFSVQCICMAARLWFVLQPFCYKRRHNFRTLYYSLRRCNMAHLTPYKMVIRLVYRTLCWGLRRKAGENHLWKVSVKCLFEKHYFFKHI